MGKILPGVITSFVNTKGGTGKTTLSLVFAGYLHSANKGLQIGVIDIDNAQNSFANLRNQETLGQDISSVKEREYEVLKMSSSDVVHQLSYLKDAFDIILLDFPGSALQGGVIETLAFVDVVLIPFEISKISIDGTKTFYNEIYKDIYDKRLELGLNTLVRGVPNKVNTQLREYKALKAGEISLPFDLLDNHVKELKVEYQRNITTLVDGYSNKSEDLCIEILNLIVTLLKK